MTVRIWCSSSSMSRTRGSAISRSNPACVASRAASSARSNSRRPACGPEPPAITAQSWASRTIGIPCSVVTVPLAGGDATRSATSRNRPGAWYSSQSETPALGEHATQLRDDQVLVGRVERHLQGTPARIFEPIERKPPGPEHPGKPQPLAGPLPDDLEAIARLQSRLWSVHSGKRAVSSSLGRQTRSSGCRVSARSF